eukprot:1183232-Rhodomonas_salina.1
MPSRSRALMVSTARVCYHPMRTVLSSYAVEATCADGLHGQRSALLPPLLNAHISPHEPPSHPARTPDHTPRTPLVPDTHQAITLRKPPYHPTHNSLSSYVRPVLTWRARGQIRPVGGRG